VIDSGKLSADQIASLKQAEIELQKQAQELGLNFEQLAVQDRASARDLQKQTKSLIPPILSILVTIGFFGILGGLMSGKIMTSDALMLMLGSLGTAWTGIIAFYFGSSASSQAKDQMIHNSTPLK
jgi:membrane-bound ClpP family serine protease